MNRTHRIFVLPYWLRATTWVVIAAQVLTPVLPVYSADSIPISLPAASPPRSSAQQEAEALTAALQKAAPPKPSYVVLPATKPKFSDPPTDDELLMCVILSEPLIPMGRQTTPEANQSLVRALKGFQERADGDDFSALTNYLNDRPDSPWRVGVLVNLGLLYRSSGYFTRALETWEEAWKLGKNEKSTKAQSLVNRAVGELAELNSRLGRYERLEPLLAELKDRPVRGGMTENLTGAREGLWAMNHLPSQAFLCGPLALDRIWRENHKSEPVPAVIKNATSTRQGTSLAQVQGWAIEAGINLQLARREPGAEVLVPAVVHWKAGHFGALIQQDKNKYLLKDPTFGGDLWISQAALESESSGYFLVASGTLPARWESVGIETASGIWGKGLGLASIST